MTVKSIIDFDVDRDGSFAKFQSLFEKYQTQLAKMPGAWAKVGKAQKSSFEAVAAALLAQNELTQQAAKNEKDLADSSDRAASGWSRLARSTKDAAHNITSATTSLLKWSTITGVVSGLLGAGGLFGIDRLAAGAGSARRYSQGVGLTIGEQRAFGVNYGRVVDPQGFLGGVNESLHDVTKRSSLYGAGLSEAQLRGKDTGEVAVALLPQLKRILDATPDALVAQVVEARKLNQFISLEEAERIKRTLPSEWKQFSSAYARDQKTLGISDKTARAWQDFDVQMSRATGNIDAVFVRGLTPLIPALTRLSESVAKSITTFLSSDVLKQWIEEAGPALEKFAKYIGSNEFQGDVKGFIDNVGALTGAIAHGLRMLGVLPASKSDPTGSPRGAITDLKTQLGEARYDRAYGKGATPHDPRFAKVINDFMKFGWSKEQAAGIAANLWTESSFKTNLWGDNHTAYGIGQWHGDRRENFKKWAGFDITDKRATFDKQEAFFNYELTKGAEQYAGKRLRATTTAEEAGGAVSRFALRPKDYFGEINKRGDLAAVEVRIYNNTGGNAVVSTAQVAR